LPHPCACSLPDLSRRDLLRPMPGLAVAAAIGTGTAASAGTIAPAPKGEALDAFDLADVALLPGPFLHAREMTARYLLSLDADRMLHQFRVNAGLKPRAPIYGGWESEAIWADIHCQGHTLGHYLSAVSLMFRATGDRRFRSRADHIVAELAACQAASKSGLVSAFPEGPQLMASFIAGDKVSGVPWYTLHKVYAGLYDADRYAGNSQARAVLVRFADWAVAATRSLSDERFEAMLNVEHGGMNEVLADLHASTGNPDYLVLARRFSHKALLDPLSKSRDHLDGLHANTQIPKIVGFQRVHEVAGDKPYGDAAAFFWRTVAETRSYVTGGHGDGEHFFPVADFDAHVFSPKGSETCCQYNMLKLSRMLFQQGGAVAHADFYERVLYNGILASQDPASGMATYFQGARPGYVKLYHTPVDSFWCCTGTGMENHAKYGEAIYLRGDRSLLVNLFIPSTLRWAEQGVTLTQTTTFPDEATTRLRWTARRPVSLALRLRHPGWSPTATVRVNGQVAAQSDKPGSLVEIDRTWADGDTVEMTLAMAVAAVPLPGSPDIVAFTYGPVVLSGALGTAGLAPGDDIVVNERKYGEYVNAPFQPPRLTGEVKTIAARVTPTGKPLEFTIPAADGTPVALKPYFRIAHERYATYWPLASA